MHFIRYPGEINIDVQRKHLIVVAMARHSSDAIVTAYPVLRYITFGEIDGMNKKKSLYIATNNTTKKHVKTKISDIELMTQKDSGSVFVGVGVHGDEVFSVVDISSHYTHDLFLGVKSQRSSILVEVKHPGI